MRKFTLIGFVLVVFIATAQNNVSKKIMEIGSNTLQYRQLKAFAAP